MEGYFEYIAFIVDEGKRIDKFLVEHLEGYTRAFIQCSIKENKVLVNGKVVKPNYKIRNKDLITGHIHPEEEIEILAEDIPLNIVYEDRDIILVNKEPNMVVHPAPGNYTGTLVNALLHYTKGELSNINGDMRPGIVHRIDKDTTGLIIIAKNNLAHENLALMLQNYEVSRKYHAIVYGNFKDEEGFVDGPIGRHGLDRTKMAVTDKNSKDALTFYKVIEQFQGFTHLELRLHTGRTHQIRVHMEHIGHPILGDLTYGPKKQPFSSTGPLLHAKMLGFNHPTTHEYMEFDCQLPLFFQNALNSLPKIKGGF